MHYCFNWQIGFFDDVIIWCTFFAQVVELLKLDTKTEVRESGVGVQIFSITIATKRPTILTKLNYITRQKFHMK